MISSFATGERHIPPRPVIDFSMKNSENFKQDLFDIVKCVPVSLLFSLGFILLFALIVRWASLDGKVITPVNYAIKILSVLSGVLIGFKGKQNGILKGAISGFLYTLLSYLIFACLDGFKSVDFNWLDLVFVPIAGGISGVIAVNLKPKRVR